jgi:cytochrome c oxidase subunit 1
MHGVVMVWFFLIPAVPVTLGNFVVPLMLGARDLAFPKLNLASWYLFVIAGIVVLYALFAGGVDTGWTFYTPLASAYSKGHVVATVVGIFLAGFSSVATGLNFIVTIHCLRAPGMTWYKMPVFLWSLYATSVILVLATPVLAMTLLLLAFERIFHIGVFDPAAGGDPLLFQHLFWFYSHPAVYVMILPGFGVISEIIPVFSRKKIFGYKFVVWCSIAIAVIGFLVWGHHMFVAGTSLYSALVFSILSYMVAVPSAIKVFNWIGTMHKGFIRFDAPMLYALGFIGLFTMGGLTGLFVAALAADVHLTQTYFVVAHFHYVQTS